MFYFDFINQMKEEKTSLYLKKKKACNKKKKTKNVKNYKFTCDIVSCT
jgi:hypothetical protein